MYISGLVVLPTINSIYLNFSNIVLVIGPRISFVVKSPQRYFMERKFVGVVETPVLSQHVNKSLGRVSIERVYSTSRPVGETGCWFPALFS